VFSVVLTLRTRFTSDSDSRIDTHPLEGGRVWRGLLCGQHG